MSTRGREEPMNEPFSVFSDSASSNGEIEPVSPSAERPICTAVPPARMAAKACSIVRGDPYASNA